MQNGENLPPKNHCYLLGNQKKSEFATWLPKKTGTKLKAESKFGEFLSPKNNLKIWQFFSQKKTGIQRQNLFPFNFKFSLFGEISHQKKTLLLACR
jgi:hypothetical protein